MLTTELDWVNRTEHREDFPLIHRKTATDGDDTYDIFLIQEPVTNDAGGYYYIIEVLCNREVLGMKIESFRFWDDSHDVDAPVDTSLVSFWEKGKRYAEQIRKERKAKQRASEYVPRSAVILDSLPLLEENKDG